MESGGAERDALRWEEGRRLWEAYRAYCDTQGPGEPVPSWKEWCAELGARIVRDNE